MNYVSELNSIIEQNLMTNHFDGEKLKVLLKVAIELRNVVYQVLLIKNNSTDTINLMLPDELRLLEENISRLMIKLGLKAPENFEIKKK